VLLRPIIAAAPSESANWLRLGARHAADVVAQRFAQRRELLERARGRGLHRLSARRQPQRGSRRLIVIGKSFASATIWRPALNDCALSARSARGCRHPAVYEKMREDHGFRMLDYSVDSDAASPRACLPVFRELPAKRTDFSPFVAVAGNGQAGAVADDKQLCVEGLQARRALQHDACARAFPRPSKETCRSRLNCPIYAARPETPSRASPSKALHPARTGQRGIPVVSVNTKVVKRRGLPHQADRNLIETVLRRDFQRNLEPMNIERMTARSAIKVWNRRSCVEQTSGTPRSPPRVRVRPKQVRGHASTPASM